MFLSFVSPFRLETRYSLSLSHHFAQSRSQCLDLTTRSLIDIAFNSSAPFANLVPFSPHLNSRCSLPQPPQATLSDTLLVLHYSTRPPTLFQTSHVDPLVSFNSTSQTYSFSTKRRLSPLIQRLKTHLERCREATKGREGQECNHHGKPLATFFRSLSSLTFAD